MFSTPRGGTLRKVWNQPCTLGREQGGRQRGREAVAHVAALSLICEQELQPLPFMLVYKAYFPL